MYRGFLHPAGNVPAMVEIRTAIIKVLYRACWQLAARHPRLENTQNLRTFNLFSSIIFARLIDMAASLLVVGLLLSGTVWRTGL